MAPDDPRPLVTGASVIEPDRETIHAHIDRAGCIFLTHSHPDHTIDMPYIAGDRAGILAANYARRANAMTTTGITPGPF